MMHFLRIVLIKKKVFFQAKISYRYRIVLRKKAKYCINIVSSRKKSYRSGVVRMNHDVCLLSCIVEMCALVGRIALLTFSSINIHFRFMENFKCLVSWMNLLIDQMSNLVLPGCIFILMMRRQMLSTYKLSLASLWLQPKSSQEQSLPVIQKKWQVKRCV